MALNFLLEHHEGVDQLLRARRAAGDVDIDGDYLVDRDQGVVVEDAGGGGAGAHRDGPLGFGHLLVEAAGSRSSPATRGGLRATDGPYTSRVSILEARGLTKTYHVGSEKVVGVSDATLALEAGSFTVLAGPSGSGKTTLLNLLGVLDQPDSGTLLFEGCDVSGFGERARARLRREKLGVVFP